mmetsp:Transcript_82669/g.221652  ORF Transcript_82669/g.221652 Transcript_82669/m.221652 type:complete len:318 (+) Transcript_82669:532-1485(+)
MDWEAVRFGHLLLLGAHQRGRGEGGAVQLLQGLPPVRLPRLQPGQGPRREQHQPPGAPQVAGDGPAAQPGRRVPADAAVPRGAARPGRGARRAARARGRQRPRGPAGGGGPQGAAGGGDAARGAAAAGGGRPQGAGRLDPEPRRAAARAGRGGGGGEAGGQGPPHRRARGLRAGDAGQHARAHGEVRPAGEAAALRLRRRRPAVQGLRARAPLAHGPAADDAEGRGGELVAAGPGGGAAEPRGEPKVPGLAAALGPRRAQRGGAARPREEGARRDPAALRVVARLRGRRLRLPPPRAARQGGVVVRAREDRDGQRQV